MRQREGRARVTVALLRAAWLFVSVWILVSWLHALRTADPSYKGEVAILYFSLLLTVNFPLAGVGLFGAGLLLSWVGPTLSDWLGVSPGVADAVTGWAVAAAFGYLQWFVLVPASVRWLRARLRRVAAR